MSEIMPEKNVGVNIEQNLIPEDLDEHLDFILRVLEDPELLDPVPDGAEVYPEHVAPILRGENPFIGRRVHPESVLKGVSGNTSMGQPPTLRQSVSGNSI